MTERPSTATVVRVTLTVAAVGVLLYGLYLVRSILVFVLVAAFLAVALDPIVRALGRLRIKRGRAVAIVFLGVVIFIGGFFASFTPPLVRQTQHLAASVPRYVNDLSKHSKRLEELDKRYDISTRLKAAVKDTPSIAGKSLGGALGIARSVGKAVFSVLTVLLLTIYFLVDLPNLHGVPRLESVQWAERDRKEREPCCFLLVASVVKRADAAKRIPAGHAWVDWFVGADAATKVGQEPVALKRVIDFASEATLRSRVRDSWHRQMIRGPGYTSGEACDF